MKKTDTTVVWLRRDLRLTDNPALHDACARSNRVVLLYIHSPHEEREWAPGAASRWWLHCSLAAAFGSAAQRREHIAASQDERSAARGDICC